MASVCQSSYAGHWYPADESELRALLADRFEKARDRVSVPESGVDVGFVVPHAAPAYSGRVAAAAYLRLAEVKPRRVLILGFCHSGATPGIAVPWATCYRTPLGEIATDPQSREFLLACEPFVCSRASDHSVEIQLPFLQFAVPEALIVPLYVGALTSAESETAAQSLAQLLTHDAVLVASSDFTHYGHAFGFVPFPLDDETPRHIREQDDRVIGSIGALDLPGYLRALRGSSGSLCGVMPVFLLMQTLRRLHTRIVHRILDYEQSGGITGDYRQSVSYAALAFSRVPESWRGSWDVEMGVA